MLSHVALGVYLVFSSCLGVGELFSASMAVPAPAPVQSAVQSERQSASTSKVRSETEKRAPISAVSPAAMHTDTLEGDGSGSKIVPVARGAGPIATNANTAKIAGHPGKPSGSPVPEPRIFALVGIGLLMLSLLRRRVARHQS